jgi:hypothetical protein
MSGTELQDDNIIIEPDAELDLGTEDENESVGDLAPPAPDTEHKKIEFTAEQQELFNREIGKKTFKLREEQRQREELERRIAAYEAQNTQQEQEPVIPDVPDQWDENYEQKLRQREDALTKRGEWNARQALLAQQAHQAEQQKAQLKQQQNAQIADEFFKRSVQSGISKEEIISQGTMVGNYIGDNGLAEALLQDESGPLIISHLASNYEDLETVGNLARQSPALAAMYIAEKIKPKVAARKPKTTQAPDPVDIIRGAGAQKKDKYYVKGATFK